MAHINNKCAMEPTAGKYLSCLLSTIIFVFKTTKDYLTHLISKIRKRDWTTEEDNEMRGGSQRNEAVPPPRQASACTALDLLVKCALTTIHTIRLLYERYSRPRSLTLVVF